MRLFEVRAGRDFWSTLNALRPKYAREQLTEIIVTIKEAIRELEREGHVTQTGRDEHRLSKSPFADGNHFEFHIHDDVLVVYFKRERNRVIRMVGVYDHGSIPSA